MDSLAVYFLDVGQGDCSFILPPKGQGDPILFDCRDSVVAERFVEDQRIQRLEAVVVSHLDRDHIAGLMEFLPNFIGDDPNRIGTLYLDLDRAASEAKKGEKGELLDWALDWAKKKLCLGAPQRDDREPKPLYKGANGWQVYIALPYFHRTLELRSEEAHAPNEFSVALRVERAGGSILIGADAPLSSWKRLEDREPLLMKAGAIRMPHHGGHLAENMRREELEEEARWLYQQINARVAVCSVGTGNPYQHPFPEHVRAAQRGGACQLLCTQLTKQCHPEEYLPKLRAKALDHASGAFYAYHDHLGGQLAVPCAGTILATIDSVGRVRVNPTGSSGRWHSKFVKKVAHPLCRASPHRNKSRS